MTTLSPRPGLFHCVVRGHVVFLDLPANRYFVLAPSLDGAFQRIVSDGAAHAALPAETARLIALNILVDGAESVEDAREPPLPHPMRSLLDETVPQSSPTRTLAFLIREIAMLVRLRIVPLEQIMKRRRLRAPESVTARGHLIRALSVIADTRAADRLLTSHNRCLSRSLAMFDAMCRRGFRPSLVIGISDTGFGAHCWLQSGEIILNEDLDIVRLYTPILVV